MNNSTRLSYPNPEALNCIGPSGWDVGQLYPYVVKIQSSTYNKLWSKSNHIWNIDSSTSLVRHKESLVSCFGNFCGMFKLTQDSKKCLCQSNNTFFYSMMNGKLNHRDRHLLQVCCCWATKTKQRKKERFERRNSIRLSKSSLGSRSLASVASTGFTDINYR